MVLLRLKVAVLANLVVLVFSFTILFWKLLAVLPTTAVNWMKKGIASAGQGNCLSCLCHYCAGQSSSSHRLEVMFRALSHRPQRPCLRPPDEHRAHCRRWCFLAELPISGTESTANVFLHDCLLIGYYYAKGESDEKWLLITAYWRKHKENNGHFNTVCCHLWFPFQCPCFLFASVLLIFFYIFTAI